MVIGRPFACLMAVALKHCKTICRSYRRSLFTNLSMVLTCQQGPRTQFPGLRGTQLPSSTRFQYLVKVTDSNMYIKKSVKLSYHTLSKLANDTLCKLGSPLVKISIQSHNLAHILRGKKLRKTQSSPPPSLLVLKLFQPFQLPLPRKTLTALEPVTFPTEASAVSSSMAAVLEAKVSEQNESVKVQFDDRNGGSQRFQEIMLQEI